MCGISAIWNWSKSEISSRQLFAAALSQRHRGPDGHGYAIWGYNAEAKWPLVWRGSNADSPNLKVDSIRLGIAHNWLAIQDTSPAAQQPMSSAGQRYWIVYNGEVYNFVELRNELAAEGFKFNTSSDTEVLLALWQKLGPKALDKIKGMFAFIIYDREKDVLWAVRDRFGIKPLYYAMLPGDAGAVFASEFRGIHASGLIPRKWNELAVKSFLAVGINNPGESDTFFQGVNEIPPGCFLEMRPKAMLKQRYYRFSCVERPGLGEEGLAELRERFLETIAFHLRSSREVGTCMSGGLDSTNVACGIRRVLADKAKNFKAFTIGLPVNEDFALAKLAANQLGLNHYAILSPKVLKLTELVDMIVACETPNHDLGPINQYLLMRYISSKHAIHVLLDGQGGDEVFSGYAWFFPVLEQFIAKTAGEAAAKSLRASHLSKPPLPLPMLNVFYQMFFSRHKWIEALDGGALAVLGVSPEEVMEWAPVNYYVHEGLDRPSFINYTFYRRELQYLLRQEDRLGMWFSIESRVPFLDHELAEFIGKFSPLYLMHDGYLKYPLRVLFPEFPKRLSYNANKRGFWENYSCFPAFFRNIAAAALDYSGSLSAIISNKDRISQLHETVLWRFFQIAVLSEVGSREEEKQWLKNITRKVPYGRLTVNRYLHGTYRRLHGALGRLKKSV